MPPVARTESCAPAIGIDGKSGAAIRAAPSRLGPVADSRGYKEVLLISEQNRDAVANLSHLNEVLETPRSQMRYVFWHEERCGVRWYKFYGLFKFMRERSQRDGKCWFERADSTISLRSRHVATLTSKIRKSDYEY